MLNFLLFSSLLVLVSVAVSTFIILKKEPTNNNLSLELNLYRQQLSEISNDIERGVLSEPEAKQSRLEIKKRLLENDLNKSEQLLSTSNKTSYLSIILISGFIIVCTSMLYLSLGSFGQTDLPLKNRLDTIQIFRDNRPSQALVEAKIENTKTTTKYDDEYLQLIQKLRDAIERNNFDIPGLKLLIKYEIDLNRFTKAHIAQKKLIAILGAKATATDHTDHVQILINAANGYVSPEAEKSLKRALKLDKEDRRALYFTGLLMAQTKRPDIAYKIWDKLLRSGNDNDPWNNEIEKTINDLAIKSGLRNN
jgi:cytochrome c-type biogenesis protein CcmH